MPTQAIWYTFKLNNIYTVSRKKSEPLKDFATTCVNFHQIKYILHTQPHVFQIMF